MIITISGIPSSGKSTIAKMLSNSLNWERRSIGDIVKHMAGDLHINEFYKNLEKNPELERSIDKKQKEWGEKFDNFIIEGRTSFYFMPKEKSYNVFFSLSLQDAAERAYKKVLDDKNVSSSLNSFPNKYFSKEEALEKITERMKTENERYKNLYGIDHLNMGNYDLVIDASGSKEEVYNSLYSAIVNELNKRK